MTTGIMCAADALSNDELVAFGENAEASGVHTIWVPELLGRDPFITCAVLLNATANVRVGTAIANVYARDARATKAAAYSLADAYDNRFDLGLGLSNKLGNAPRGHEWLAVTPGHQREMRRDNPATGGPQRAREWREPRRQGRDLRRSDPRACVSAVGVQEIVLQVDQQQRGRARIAGNVVHAVIRCRAR